MPVFCAAYGCNNRRSIDTRSCGITFHKFPSDTGLKGQWEVAVRREGFVATNSSKLCSEHFKLGDFDRTGQTVRLRDGAIPSVTPSHLQIPVVTRNTKTLRKAEESLPVDLSQHFPQGEPQPNDDHSYAFPNSPTRLQARLGEALARVKSLEREKQNAKARERRAKKTIKSLLEDLKKKNLINEELKEKLDFHSDFPQQQNFKEKEAIADQGVCNQEESSNYNQEEPEPVQIKEDLEKLCTTQQGELPVLKQEANIIVVTPVDEQRDHSETDSMSEQLLPPKSPQAKSEDELGSKLLETSETLQMWTPQIKLRRIEFPQQHHSKEEEYTPDQEESSNLDHVKPEPPLVKEELEKHDITQQGEQLVLKQETPICEESDHGVSDSIREQLLPPSCPPAESQAELGSQHAARGSIKDSGQKTKTKRDRLQSNGVKHTPSHSKSGASENSVKCDICGIILKKRAQINNHYKIHTSVRPHTCTICQKGFIFKCHLTYHMRNHTGERPFSCKTCGKGFALRGTLSQHLKSHNTAERHNCCEKCGKTIHYST